MRVNSITSYTRSASAPQKTDKNKNQNGHAVNFGNLTKPIDVFKKEILAIKGFEEGLKKANLNLDSCLRYFEEEKEVLVGVKNGIIQISMVGESKFTRLCRDLMRRDADVVDYMNITKPKDLITASWDLSDIRYLLDEPYSPTLKQPESESATWKSPAEEYLWWAGFDR